MPRLAPLTPIFDPPISRGQVNTGSLIGTQLTLAHPLTVTRPVSTLVPTVQTFIDPGSISNLLGWWDASDLATITESGGNVTQWDDKSGNGWHMTVEPINADEGPVTGSRTKNGLNVLDFQNSAGALAPPGQALETSASMRPLAVEYQMFVVFVQDATAANVQYPAWFGSAGTGHGIDIPASGTAARVFISAGGAVSATGDSVATGTWRLVTGTFGDNLEPLTIRDNGVTTGEDESNGSPTDDIALTVGARAAAQRLLDGAIAEILIYQPHISTSDRDAVEEYLIFKWGIP